MNDVRAIIDNQFIPLFCRYTKDVPRVNQRIINFADSHSDICGCLMREVIGGVDAKTITMTWKE